MLNTFKKLWNEGYCFASISINSEHELESFLEIENFVSKNPNYMLNIDHYNKTVELIIF